jgi:hypothetical protein
MPHNRLFHAAMKTDLPLQSAHDKCLEINFQSERFKLSQKRNADASMRMIAKRKPSNHFNTCPAH